MTLHVEVFQPDAGKHDLSKPILILVHGGALSHRMYKDCIPFLTARGYRVLAPDLPGHGKSVELGPFTFAKSTELLLEAVETNRSNNRSKLVLVGISLGGQAVLDLIAHHPGCAHAAIVSGVSIHPPDDKASWEMPHMPTSPDWIQLMTQDVNIMGMDNAQNVQAESFAFNFNPPAALPPVLIMIGESDVAMAKRDFDELSRIAVDRNNRSSSVNLEQAWHNHSIDIPERFAAAIDSWACTTKA